MFQHNRKGLGAIREVAPDGDWVLTFTKEGDGFASLQKAYGATAQDIVAKNGIKFTAVGIQEWIKSKNGRVQPLVPGKPAVPGGKEGFAVFTSRSQILLPNKLRADGFVPPGQNIDKVETPAGTVAKKISDQQKIVVLLAAAAACALILKSGVLKKSGLKISAT